jgi:hypothetical protein
MKLAKITAQQPAPAAEGTDPLKAHFSEQAQAASAQRQLLYEYVEQARERNANWLDRIFASSEEKQMLDTFRKKQEQALESVLDERNASLKIIGEAQLAFILEICDSLLISTRSQIQSGRSAAFQERFLQLNHKLEALNTNFFSLVEQKIEQFEQASGKIKELHGRQLDRMLEQWEHTYAALLDEFAEIITQRRSA